MAAIPLIRTSLLLRFTNFLDQVGVPTVKWMERSPLSPALLNHPEGLLPIVQASALIEQIARAEGIDTLGLIVGQRTQAHNLGDYGLLLSRSLTLYDLLLTLERTINLLNSGERVRLTWQSDAVWLQSHLYAIAKNDAPQSHYFSLMTHLSMIRMALGHQWKPPAVQIAIKPNQAIAMLTDLEGVHVQYDALYNSIKIPKALLNVPLAFHHQTANLPSPNDNQLYTSAPASDLVESLRQFIAALLPQGYPDIALAAEAAGLSIRSLQRRLAASGLNYGAVVEQVRFKLAVQYLQDPTLKLTHIAAELGYTDAANFTRAFKRWTGLSPRAYRLISRG